MSVEMMTKIPQWSDWSLEEGTIVERQHSFTTNKENNMSSNNTWIDGNKDEFRRYEKTKLKSLFILPQCYSSMSPCFQGLILGVLTAILLLVIVISLWLTSMHKTPTMNSITTQISTLSTVLTNSSSTTSTTTDSTTTVSTTTAALTVTITSNICTSTITAIQMVASCFPCPAFLPYVSFLYPYTAISNVTRIAFAYRRQSYYFALDSISVRDCAAPSTEILTNGGFETGDLTFWIYCNQNNASSTGGVHFNTSFSYNSFTYFPQSGMYYYVGGSTISADYISQSFPTIIGHEYNISMWSMFPGSGNLTSANLFLGI